jgi:hypothetical protein
MLVRKSSFLGQHADCVHLIVLRTQPMFGESFSQTRCWLDALPPCRVHCLLVACVTPVHVSVCVQVLQQLERRAGLQHKFVGRVGKHAVESDDRWG